MSDSELLYSVDQGVATLTFNRPEFRNAFGDETRELLLQRLKHADTDPAVGCIVITGTGEAFAAGGDIRSMAALQANDDAGVVCARMDAAARIVHALRSMATPVIAAVNGAAAGAGMNLALACDLRYASDTAFFAETFVRVGLVPDWGGHYLLTRLVGTSQAMELMMLGDRIDAETALRLGLVNAVFPAASFREAVHAKAKRLADGPRAVISAIKRGAYTGATGSLDETLAFEQSVQAELFLANDAREGMQAFLEKRPPKFNQR